MKICFKEYNTFFFLDKYSYVLLIHCIFVLCCIRNLDEWWKLFGSCAPIFSQIVAFLGCEWNWSVLEQIHTKRRNKLEYQQLNDFVYVHYNYQLKDRYIDLVQLFKYYEYSFSYFKTLICVWLVIIHMFILWYSSKSKKFNFDPIDYASIDKTEFWVVEDEEPPLLNQRS